MSDNVSLSLDEYIKRQKKQTPRNAKGASSKNQNKGKAKPRNQTFRYHQAGGVTGNRGQNVKVGRLAGRKGLGRVAAGTVGGGNGGFSRKFNKRNNNRMSAMKKNRPVGVNTNLEVRTRRFGSAGVSVRKFPPQFKQAAVRNQFIMNRQNWKKNTNRPFRNNKLALRINNSPFQQRINNGRLSRPKGNARLQNLIRKRIKNARSLLASKSLITRNQRTVPSQRRRNFGLVAGTANLQNRQISQQKLNRAKLIRARIRNNKLQRTGGSLRNRGLSVDRNNLVRVRVANDFRQNYGGPSITPSYHPASAMYSPLMPPNFQLGLPDPEFPSFTMHNTISNPMVDEMEVCRSSLDPNIQRKISVIQNRARNSNMSPARVMSDFKAPVSSSAMKLGDRFRMMMR